jgi:hypothetical protein
MNKKELFKNAGLKIAPPPTLQIKMIFSVSSRKNTHQLLKTMK